MSLGAATLQTMLDMGLTLEQVVKIASTMETEAPASGVLEKRRAYDRERKAKKRNSTGLSTGQNAEMSTGNSTGIPPDKPPLARVRDNNPTSKVSGNNTTLHLQARDLSELSDRLKEAGGRVLSDPSISPGLINLSPILRLLQPNGHGPPCDLELDILPSIRTRCTTGKTGSIRSWSYFEPMIIEARDLRLSGPPATMERSHVATASNSKFAAKQANLERAFRAASDFAAENGS